VSAQCFSCGIANLSSDGSLWCFKYKFEIDVTIDKSDCYYYIEPQIEEGKPLTAEQTLMIKECDLASRRMRGPEKFS